MKKVISNTIRKNEKEKIITKRYLNAVYWILFLCGIRISFTESNLILHTHHIRKIIKQKSISGTVKHIIISVFGTSDKLDRN
jgi:hypothetical protein